MALRSSFRLNVAARIALLGALLFVLLWGLLHTTWDALPLVAMTLLAIATFELFRYVERGTRDLTELLSAVAHGDFTTAMPRRGGGPPFSEYEEAAHTLVGAYQRLDLQRAASDELLRATAEHIGAAVLCFNRSGQVPFANTAARELLGVQSIRHLDVLAAVDSALPQRLLELADDERARIALSLGGEPALLLLHARCFTLLDQPFTVVACQNIHEELESRDIEAWQSLTRVLTHEMMNSLTPIMTLSGLLRDTLGKGGYDADRDDVAESIEVIHERSSGLASFIQAYRQFSNPPLPVATRVSAAALLERVARLKGPGLAAAGIRLDIVVEAADLALQVDGQQVAQVLINLVRNCEAALAGQAGAGIELRASPGGRGRTLLHVTDNGPGIDAGIRMRIFVPFFTTRGDGTGIGLSLSRQITQMNGGTLTADGTPGRCRFTMRLPAG